MLDGLFVTPTVTAISEALGRADGPIAVVGNARIAAALGGKREVIAVGITERAAKKLGKTLPDLATVEPGTLAAVVGVELATAETGPETLREYARVVRDGGTVILVDRGHAPEASRRALCAGLAEIEQRHAGRTVVTSGLVTHL